MRVRGHTAQSGDPEHNQKLSLERAEAVARYMNVTYNVDPNRIKVLGMGSSQPLPRAAERIRSRVPVPPAARRSLPARGCLLSALTQRAAEGPVARRDQARRARAEPAAPVRVYPAVLGALGGIGAMVVAGSPLILGAVLVAGGAAARGACRQLFLAPRPHRGLLPGRRFASSMAAAARGADRRPRGRLEGGQGQRSQSPARADFGQDRARSRPC